MNPENFPSRLLPLPYHLAVVGYLQTAEPELWAWFADTQAASSLRQHLLKTTYRLEADAHPVLHEQLSETCRRLELDVPVTLYQSTEGGEINAMLCYESGEAHVVFQGPALTLLEPLELRAVLGHELAHFHLWNTPGETANSASEYLIADRMLMSQAEDPRAHPAHLQTARRYRLYTEILADRGALLATGDLSAAVTALVKMQTGLATARGENYLRQAEEIYAQSTPLPQGESHPETFIRARALQLWAQQAPDLESLITSMIEGEHEQLDLPGQSRLTLQTRQLLQQFLQPPWFQTPSTLAHARLFFTDFQPATSPEPVSLDPRFKDFWTRLLLDFAQVDPDLERLPLSAAVIWSRRLGLEEMLDRMVIKELKLKQREWTRLKKDAESALVAAEGVRP